MAMRPDQVADPRIAEPQPDRRQAQQVDQTETFAAVMQADRYPCFFFQAAQVITERGRAHEFIHPGQGPVEPAHIVAGHHLDASGRPPLFQLIQRRQRDDLVAQLRLASDIDNDFRHGRPPSLAMRPGDRWRAMYREASRDFLESL
ncbi:hypothetical protein D3C71_1639280 [compost metagenome]